MSSYGEKGVRVRTRSVTVLHRTVAYCNRTASQLYTFHSNDTLAVRCGYAHKDATARYGRQINIFTSQLTPSFQRSFLLVDSMSDLPEKSISISVELNGLVYQGLLNASTHSNGVRETNITIPLNHGPASSTGANSSLKADIVY